MPICYICKKESIHELLTAREMVHGTREPFQYSLCSACGTLALVDCPSDLTPYYQNYYSTSALDVDPFNRSSWLCRLFVNRVKKWALRHSIHGSGSLADHIEHRKTVHVLGWGPIFSKLRQLGIPISLKTSFLDVGCGVGRGLHFLADAGFTNLTGCDPFIDEELTISPHGKILKVALEQIQGRFDVIMYHHSFEHIPDPATSLKSAVARLAPGGIIVLRFPNIASIEFLKHKGNWWGIHAPRHFFIPSQAAMRLMICEADIEILHVYCDSTYDHYLYSTEYELDIHDGHPLSFRADAHGLWTKHELKEAQEKADLFNRKMCGDWITYILRRSSGKI
jgi:2-polyprenyl-3-methyl-5-hydroxy-6-metoxy-1,4-benzoquinol methylase